MKRRFSILLATCLFAVGSADVAHAANNEFSEGLDNNYWQNDNNWSLGHEPEADERAIIPAGEDCVIHAVGADAVAESFSVLGTLTIEGGRKLTITANSTIGGELIIEGDFSAIGELVIDGTVRLQSKIFEPGTLTLAGGKISGTSTDHLTLYYFHGLLVRGYGEIAVPLTNELRIDANESGKTLYLSDFDMDGSAGPTEWRASGGGTLQVDVEVTGSGYWHAVAGDAEIILNVATCVSGDVRVAQATLTYNAEFCTTGDLTWVQDGTILVAQGETAMFGGSLCSGASCP